MIDWGLEVVSDENNESKLFGLGWILMVPWFSRRADDVPLELRWICRFLGLLIVYR